MTGARLDTPNVSVLIPAFNMDRVLETAVASALDQDGVTVEVVVIDDASTDGTPDLVAGMARKDARVHPVRLQENAGPGAARSAGLAQARGDWVAVLDADDRFAPGRLAHLLALARARNLDAVADNLTLVDPGLGRAVGRAFPLEEEAEITLTAERFLANSVPGARVNVGWAQPMVRRDFLERHGVAWPSLRHAEDMVFAMRLLMAGARWGLSGRAGYFYTQRRGTVSGRPLPFREPGAVSPTSSVLSRWCWPKAKSVCAPRSCAACALCRPRLPRRMRRSLPAMQRLRAAGVQQQDMGWRH
ncbi:MAG: glycosyltransferase family 2 protein [Rhodobacteraceae bacterium]|nr:glycosyltransferase family 2 protein [Paracoccaceae bacterium]